MTNTIKANRLILNRSNELVYDKGNAWCPMGAYAVKELADALLAHGDSTIQVSFRSYNDKTAEQDKKTYGRRLQALQPFYSFGGFQPLVIDGHVQNHTFVGTLSRSIQ